MTHIRSRQATPVSFNLAEEMCRSNSRYRCSQSDSAGCTSGSRSSYHVGTRSYLQYPKRVVADGGSVSCFFEKKSEGKVGIHIPDSLVRISLPCFDDYDAAAQFF